MPRGQDASRNRRECRRQRDPVTEPTPLSKNASQGTPFLSRQHERRGSTIPQREKSCDADSNTMPQCPTAPASPSATTAKCSAYRRFQMVLREIEERHTHHRDPFALYRRLLYESTVAYEEERCKKEVYHRRLRACYRRELHLLARIDLLEGQLQQEKKGVTRCANLEQNLCGDRGSSSVKQPAEGKGLSSASWLPHDNQFQTSVDSGAAPVSLGTGRTALHEQEAVVDPLTLFCSPQGAYGSADTGTGGNRHYQCEPVTSSEVPVEESAMATAAVAPAYSRAVATCSGGRGLTTLSSRSVKLPFLLHTPLQHAQDACDEQHSPTASYSPHNIPPVMRPSIASSGIVDHRLPAPVRAPDRTRGHAGAPCEVSATGSPPPAESAGAAESDPLKVPRGGGRAVDQHAQHTVLPPAPLVDTTAETEAPPGASPSVRPLQPVEEPLPTDDEPCRVRQPFVYAIHSGAPPTEMQPAAAAEDETRRTPSALSTRTLSRQSSCHHVALGDADIAEVSSVVDVSAVEGLENYSHLLLLSLPEISAITHNSVTLPEPAEPSIQEERSISQEDSSDGNYQDYEEGVSGTGGSIHSATTRAGSEVVVPISVQYLIESME